MKDFNFQVDYVREQFPALSKTVNGLPVAYLDGPGGTQIPRRVADKVVDYLYYRNANAHGAFHTSAESDNLVLSARKVYADFFNCSFEEVIFGENTTTNNFKLALSMARTLKPGDEVIITDIDHEGNRSPWRVLADFGIIVKSVKIHSETITLDFENFKSKVSDKTKLLAINWAANSCGTISDIKKFIDIAHEHGAITVVDAVHYAPHRLIDVKAVGTDFLLCSSYKFFGPHLGIMYCNKEIGEKMKSTRVMANDNSEMPYRFETGTLAMELISGAAEAVAFIADVGRIHMRYFEDELKGESGRRKEIIAGMMAIDAYEENLASQLRASLSALPKVKVYGPEEGHPRTSTVSFTIDGANANDIAKFFAKKALYVWDGDFYAIETINETLKLETAGGLVRIGLAPYNIQGDIDRVISAVKEYCNI